MNVALVMGRKGSLGVPGKNVRDIGGHPMCWYPMVAAKAARHVEHVYVTTDCPRIKEVALALGVSVIERPPHLARAESEMSEAIVHAAKIIEDRRKAPIDIMVTMHANCAIHKPGLVDELVTKLVADLRMDSCVSARFVTDQHPYRVKRVTDDGMLHTWVQMPDDVSNNRQAITQRAVVLDGACRAFRVARCLPPTGQPPFRYLGHRIGYVENPDGLDVHNEADLVLTEMYLARQHDAEQTGT